MPRSASRDRSDPFEGKRGYFRYRTLTETTRVSATIVAGLLAALWATYDILGGERVHDAHTHGDLTHAHSAWEHDCQACHNSFDRADFLKRPLSAFHPEQRWKSFSCEQCHRGAPHRPVMNARSSIKQDACHECHHDHRGKDQSLTRIDDSHCVRCHADLPRYVEGQASASAPSITSFRDHPQFAPLTQFRPERDRSLKFSHSLHMTPGLVYHADSRQPFTTDRLPAEDRGRYAKFTGMNGQITLDCAACHALDSQLTMPNATEPGGQKGDRFSELLLQSGQPVNAIRPPRAQGANFLPVNFDMHCRACHPITTPALVEKETVIPEMSLPHRLPEKELMPYIAGAYARFLATDTKHRVELPPRSGGGVIPTAPTTRNETAELKTLVDSLSGKARDRILPATSANSTGGCWKCHTPSGETGSKQVIAAIPNRTIWFTKAKFDHTSHRMATCTSCHPGTTSQVKDRVTLYQEREPVQILGLSTCQTCHGPDRQQIQNHDGRSFVAGGVSARCTDCHTYHNGEHPLQGRAAEARMPKTAREIEDLFRAP